MGKERVLYIDLLKFVAIFFVTWGHTIGQFGTHTDVCNNLSSWRFTIDMPLFAILSGIFFKVPEDISYWEQIKKKIRGLLIPNAIWCFLFYIAMHGIFMGIQTLRGQSEIYQGNLLWDWWYAIWYEGWWFLRALLFVYVYAISAVWTVRKIGLGSNLMLVAGLGSTFLLYACSLSGIIPNHLPTLIGFVYLYPFVWTGVAIKALDRFMAKHMGSILLSSVIVWAVGLYYWQNSYTFYGMNTSIFADGDVVAGMNVLWVTLYRYIVGVAASLAVMSLIRCLTGSIKHGDSKLIDYLVDIGKYTLFIYIAPSFFFHAVKQRVLFQNEIESFAFCTLISIFIVAVCYWIAKLIERWTWARRLLLGIWK